MAALKQRYAQPCLELLDPSAQRRLRDRTTFRSTAEMALLGQRAQKAELLKTGQDGHRNVFIEAVRFYPLDQWPRMADLPQTRDTSRQMTLPWLGTYKSIACEHLTFP
jgi:hypothetical protein